ncbi:MAG: serine acetyltransferase-like protein [Kouleothrix sp.]|jgi:serine O-acetyltransferase|nr:serine acetyltransferase-like protein [Kouleothrix sp.]
MTFTELIDLIAWDLRINRGYSFDSVRAILLLIEVRIEQYTYRKCRTFPLFGIWYIVRCFGSMFQWFLCNSNIPGTITIGRGLRLPHPQNIILAGYADIGEFCTIYHNVSIAWNGFKRTVPSSPKIGDQVLIGAGAILVGDITVGSDVLIGAGAVVTRSVSDHARVTSPRPDITHRTPSALAATPGSEQHIRDPYSIWR